MHTTLIGPAPRIAVDHAGAGELVLFLHGVGGHRDNWRDNLPVFAAEYLAAAWDARGYGDSEDGLARFRDFRDDVGRVLDHFGAETAHLVGLSMGARIALAFHDAAPERVASLVLCDTHLGFDHLSERDRRTFIARRKEPLLTGKEPADIAPGLARALIGNAAHEAALERLVRSMSRLRAASYIKAIEVSTEEDLAPLVDSVRVPTLVVVGALDRITPPALAAEIAGRIPGAQLRVIEDAGHLCNIEQPEAFDAAVLGFLREASRRASPILPRPTA